MTVPRAHEDSCSTPCSPTKQRAIRARFVTRHEPERTGTARPLSADRTRPRVDRAADRPSEGPCQGVIGALVGCSLGVSTTQKRASDLRFRAHRITECPPIPARSGRVATARGASCLVPPPPTATRPSPPT